MNPLYFGAFFALQIFIMPQFKTRLRLSLLATFTALLLNGCVVVSTTASVVGATVSVGAAVVSTTATVVGTGVSVGAKAVEATADVASAGIHAATATAEVAK